MGIMPPEISNSRQKSTIITHKEYITDVVSSTASNTSLTLGTNLFGFPIQPASSTTFPWLATIASGYQEYRLLGMVFEFKSTCGSAVSSTNNAMGSVLMSTQYRAAAPVFINKQQMDNEQYSVDIVPWTNGCHFIECAPHLSPLTTQYIRTGNVPGESLELFDIGTFYLATCGQQAAGVVLGELWCSYQVELLKPQLPKASGAFGSAILTLHATGSGCTSASPFGTLTLDTPGSNIGVDSSTSNGITLSGNQFSNQAILLVTAYWLGVSTSSVRGTVFGATNATAHNEWGPSNTISVPSAVTTSDQLMMQASFHVVTGSLAFTLSLTTSSLTLPTGATLYLIITQINDSD